MRKPRDTKLEAAEQLLIALEEYYDVSEETLEPIVPGHPVHAAVGNWRQSLPRKRLPPEFGDIRDHLWVLSKADRGKAKSAASDFAELLIRKYPSLAEEDNDDSCIAAGQWFDSLPPDSPFQHGPLSGQMKQLVSWLACGEQRTLMKHNGRGGYYITKEHGRRFSVWFSSSIKFEEAQQRRRSENA